MSLALLYSAVICVLLGNELPKFERDKVILADAFPAGAQQIPIPWPPPNPLNVSLLSPECAVAWMEIYDATVNFHIFYDTSLNIFWWQHSSGYGDQQMGLIDRCNRYNGEYCTITKADTYLEMSDSPFALATGGLKSGCCIPPDCATDERDIKVRVLLCDPKLYAFLAALELTPNPSFKLSFENATVSCGSGKYEITTGTYLVYALIIILAALVFFASIGEYYRSVYTNSYTKDDIETFNTKLPAALRAFSFQTNWNALMERPERPTNFLDGIRAMSFMWVVLGHCLSTEAFNALGMRTYDNSTFVSNNAASKMWFIIFILSALFSVDSFFWLGGFLFSYVYVKKLEKMRNPMQRAYIWWPMIYVQRWLRLVPALMFVILLAWLVIPTWLDTTVPAQNIDNYKTYAGYCGTDWWRTVLFLTTLDDELMSKSRCMGHTWYLSTEFCIVWFTPFFFIAYLYHPICGVLSTSVGLFVGLISTAYVVHKYNLGSTIIDPNYMSVYYLRPYTRCGVYCIGFGLGLFCRWLDKRSKELGIAYKINPWSSTILQIVGCAVLFTLVSVQHNGLPNGLLVDVWSHTADGVWDVVCRPCWGIGLSILCFSILYGPRGGFIPNFLSWSFWGPISKLSYSAYLIHYPLYDLRCVTLINNQHYTSLAVLETWLGHTGLALFAAMGIWILVEAPFATLSKTLLASLQAPQKKVYFKHSINGGNLLDQPILSDVYNSQGEYPEGQRAVLPKTIQVNSAR